MTDEPTYAYFDMDVTESEYRDGHYQRVQRLHDATEVPLPYGGPYSYNETPEVVHADHFVEHVTKVIVVGGPNQRAVLNSRSGVLWFGHDGQVEDKESLRLAVSLSDTGVPYGPDDCAVERPDDYEQLRSGWHDSIHRSELSDVVNELAKGDVSPESLDNHDPFPYVVKFGDTNNVCSQPASIYGTPETREWIDSLLDGKRAKPAYAGI
jgi:hypothetical protein